MFFYGLIYQLIAFMVFKRFSGYFVTETDDVDSDDWSNKTKKIL